MAHAATPLPDVVIVGHSFIRRYRDHLIPPAAGFPGQGQDITAAMPLVARQAAINAALDRRINGIYTVANQLNLIANLHMADATLNAVQPQIVILNVGSNDLANLTGVNNNHVLTMINSLVAFGEHCRADYATQLVVINSIVPRLSNIACTPSDFTTNMETFNRLASNWCSGVDGLMFNRLRGFYMKHIDNKIEIPLPVHEWSYDGIHCDYHTLERFTQRLRFSIMLATTKLS